MVEMESYGIASVALLEKVPSLTVRIISDACWETATLNPAGQPVNTVLTKFLLSFIGAI